MLGPRPKTCAPASSCASLKSCNMPRCWCCCEGACFPFKFGSLWCWKERRFCVKPMMLIASSPAFLILVQVVLMFHLSYCYRIFRLLVSLSWAHAHPFCCACTPFVLCMHPFGVHVKTTTASVQIDSWRGVKKRWWGCWDESLGRRLRFRPSLQVCVVF